MKLSLRSEYALLSLIYIARQSDVTSAKIGSAQHIPTEQLREVLTVLVDAGYLRRVKGNLRLARVAEGIPVADVIRLFDGALAPLEPVSERGYLPAPMEKEEKLAGLFTRLQDQIVVQLEETTLAELI